MVSLPVERHKYKAFDHSSQAKVAGTSAIATSTVSVPLAALFSARIELARGGPIDCPPRLGQGAAEPIQFCFDVYSGQAPSSRRTTINWPR